MRRILCAFALSVLFSPLCSSQDKQFEDDWMRAKNSPNSSLTLKETGRGPYSGHTVVTYRLFASGLPKDGHYALWTRLLGGKPQSVAAAFINSDGLVVSRLADPAHNVAEDPIDVVAYAGMGEPKQFALRSLDGKLQAFASVIPFPIEQSSGGCQLTLEMGAPDYTIVFVHGFGFQPNEPLVVATVSGSEGGKSQTSSTSTGTYSLLLAPTVKGQISGKASVTVTGANCAVAIQFPWGEGSYKIQ